MNIATRIAWLSVSLAISPGASASADNWPQWRGPAGTGASGDTRLPESWVGGIYTASPVAGDGKIYLLSESGETLVLRAGRTPELLARNTIDGRVLASPAISDGRIFIRSDDPVVAVGR